MIENFKYLFFILSKYATDAMVERWSMNKK